MIYYYMLAISLMLLLSFVLISIIRAEMLKRFEDIALSETSFKAVFNQSYLDLKEETEKLKQEVKILEKNIVEYYNMNNEKDEQLKDDFDEIVYPIRAINGCNDMRLKFLEDVVFNFDQKLSRKKKKIKAKPKKQPTDSDLIATAKAQRGLKKLKMFT